jgi:uncharacterized protein YkwD
VGKSSLIAAAVSACALAAPTAAAAYTCAGADAQPAAAGLHRARSATFCLINLERSHHGLPILLRQRRLMKVSGRFSRQMVARRFFDHVAPDGIALAQRVAGPAGEILAWGATDISTPAQIMADWMASPPHRRVILSRRFSQMGMGIAFGSPLAGPSAPAVTYTVDFGR